MSEQIERQITAKVHTVRNDVAACQCTESVRAFQLTREAIFTLEEVEYLLGRINDLQRRVDQETYRAVCAEGDRDKAEKEIHELRTVDPMKQFRVGVFQYEGKRGPRFMAYTRYYSPSWKGCCEHIVVARNGSEAKQIAIDEHRGQCPLIEPRATGGQEQS